MSNNAKVAGVLNIVSGGVGVLGALGLALVIMFFGVMFTETEYYDITLSPESVTNIITLVYGASAFVLALISVLAIISGVYALKRRYWGLALAGAIVSIFIFFPCGVVAVVFAAMAKPEFDTTESPPYAMTP